MKIKVASTKFDLNLILPKHINNITILTAMKTMESQDPQNVAFSSESLQDFHFW